MEPRITVITLAVNDLERALRFYREGMGLPSAGIMGTEWEHGSVAFFELAGGMHLALYPRENVAAESGTVVAEQPAHQCTLGYNVRERAEVDDVLSQARSAGAMVVDQPHERPWGIYSGHFADPDGHLWEIVWNPNLVPA